MFKSEAEAATNEEDEGEGEGETKCGSRGTEREEGNGGHAGEMIKVYHKEGKI